MGENIIKQKTLALLKASAPWKWPVGAAGALLGLALAATQGAVGFEPWRALGCALIALGLLAAANLVEDLNAPKGVTASGQLKKKETQAAVVGALVFTILMAIFTVPMYQMELWIIGALAMITAIARPKTKAWYKAKETLAGIFFGPVAVMGTERIVSGMYSIEGLIVGLAAGCLAAGLAMSRSLRDEEADKTAGHLTIVVEKGREKGLKIFKYLLIAGATLTGMAAGLSAWIWGGTIIALTFGARMNATIEKLSRPHEYDDLGGRLAWWIFVWALAVTLGLYIK